MDPDMTLCSSPSVADNITLSAGYSDQDVPGDSMFLGRPHDHRFLPTPRVSMWPLVATWTTDINTGALGCSSAPRIKTWPLVITQVQTNP